MLNSDETRLDTKFPQEAFRATVEAMPGSGFLDLIRKGY